MNRKLWIVVIIAAVVVLGATLFVDLRETAAASTLSVGARGWLAARLYLEQRGVDVTLLDRPLHESPQTGVLVLAFPWQRRARAGEADSIGRRLLAGDTILFAYAGETITRSEEAIAERLGLDWETLREPPPLGPMAWRRFVAEEWSLSAVGDRRPLHVTAFSRAPRAPEHADIWYRAPGGEPVVFAYESGAGRIVVLPTETFANARIASAGNADLLESLSSFAGTGWLFDEFHHGLDAAASTEQARPRVALDALLAHLALLYVLVVWRMAKRFGPTRQERALLQGSTRSFLLGLGSLHDRLKHHREAARLLVFRARAFQPHIDFAMRTDVETGAALVRLAVDTADRQSSRRSST